MADNKIVVDIAAGEQTVPEAADKAKSAIDDLKKSTAAGADVDKLAAKEAEGLDIKKRELLESTRALTREFPILGEVMGAAYNPVALAIFGIIGATELWEKRTSDLVKTLGGIELPDLTEGINQAENIATAYDGITTAVAAANEQFNAAAAAFERQEKAVSAALAAMKQLIAAQKEKAIADLDLQRSTGQITPAMYAAKKSIIDQGYNDATTQAEIEARNSDLSAQMQQAENLKRDAAAKAAKAAAVKLPDDDAGAKANSDAYKKMADTRQKEADDAREQVEKQRGMLPDDTRTIMEHFFSGLNILKQFVTPATFGMSPQELLPIQEGKAKTAQDAADAAAKTAAGIDAEIEKRKKLREDAEKTAADAAKAADALQGQDDPNKVNSVAWHNKQDRAAQAVRDAAGNETRGAGDISAINKDLAAAGKETGPKALAVHADMVSALQDLIALVTIMANAGQDVTTLKQQIATLTARVNASTNTGNSR